MSESPDNTAGIIIYHNPRCGTSRNTLALIRHSGVEPAVIEYLKTPLIEVPLLIGLVHVALRFESGFRQAGRVHPART